MKYLYIKNAAIILVISFMFITPFNALGQDANIRMKKINLAAD